MAPPTWNDVRTQAHRPPSRCSSSGGRPSRSSSEVKPRPKATPTGWPPRCPAGRRRARQRGAMMGSRPTHPPPPCSDHPLTMRAPPRAAILNRPAHLNRPTAPAGDQQFCHQPAEQWHVTANTASAARNTRRRPSRSAARPPSSSSPHPREFRGPRPAGRGRGARLPRPGAGRRRAPDQSALSRLIDRLEVDGLVERCLCGEDRRGIYVKLSWPAGSGMPRRRRRTGTCSPPCSLRGCSPRKGEVPCILFLGAGGSQAATGVRSMGANPLDHARRRRGVIRSGTENIAPNRSASPNRAPMRSAYLAR